MSKLTNRGQDKQLMTFVRLNLVLTTGTNLGASPRITKTIRVDIRIMAREAMTTITRITSTKLVTVDEGGGLRRT